MSRVETIGNANVSRTGQLLKDSVACKKCDWVWKPTLRKTIEPCPKCGTVRCVRKRKFPLKSIESLKNWRANRPGYSTETDKRMRHQARLLVGRGEIRCLKCGCNREELLEINHKNGGGGKELRGAGNKFYRDIAKLRRDVDDLELLCRVCNSLHYLELKHGVLPFSIIWNPENVI